MERNSKIIIAVLVIIVIALVAAIGLSFFGDMNQPKTNSTNVTNGNGNGMIDGTAGRSGF